MSSAGSCWSPVSYLDLIYRFRLDGTTLAYREQQASITTGPQNLRVGATYILVPAQTASDVVDQPGPPASRCFTASRSSSASSVTAKLTRYWSLQGSETINLTGSTNIINGVATPESSNSSLYASLSAIYQDECMAFVGAITQSGITQRRGDARLLGAVQRRIQEHRRIRRQRRLDRRDRRLNRKPGNDPSSSHRAQATARRKKV